MALDILIVDDERDIRELVAGVLSDEGYECRTAGDSRAALAAVDERRPSLVLLDVWLHGSPMDGLEVLDEIKKREPELPVIIFSGHGNIDTAVSAVSRGAMDFIEKPFEAEKLLLLVQRATETERLRRENARLREGFARGDEFTGNSVAINAVRATLKRVASTGSRVMITGPAGAGKEVAARLLHAWSTARRQRLRDRQFGAHHARAVRAGAVRRRGRRQARAPGPARNGRRRHALPRRSGRHAALDAGAHPARADRAELRARRRQSARCGSTCGWFPRPRAISTGEMEEKRFREDLFYRLNVVPVAIPSLAERRDDIPALAEHFFTRYAAEQGMPAPELADEAHRRAAGLRLAGQRAPAAQRGRAHDHPDPARTAWHDRGRHAAGRGHRRRAGRGRRACRPLMGVPLREARESFEREYLTHPDPPLFGQHLEDRQFHRDGALAHCTANSSCSAWATRREEE